MAMGHADPLQAGIIAARAGIATSVKIKRITRMVWAPLKFNITIFERHFYGGDEVFSTARFVAKFDYFLNQLRPKFALLKRSFVPLFYFSFRRTVSQFVRQPFTAGHKFEFDRRPHNCRFALKRPD
jgi:hypothetical protein